MATCPPSKGLKIVAEIAQIKDDTTLIDPRRRRKEEEGGGAGRGGEEGKKCNRTK